MGKNRKDYSGNVYGNLTIIKYISFNAKRCSTVWEAKCKCGNTRTIDASSLRRASERNYSLSCGKCDYSERLVNSDETTKAINLLYLRYQSGAKTRNLEFNLTLNEFKRLTDGNCYYCGTEPYRKSITETKRGSYTYNGIDRLNASIGYNIDNCVTACCECNIMKQAMNEKEFINQVDKINKHYHAKKHDKYTPSEFDL